MVRKKVIILGAAGRDFHNFLTHFKDNRDYEVVAFTATQIPFIDDKMFPASMSGELYPNGVPIVPEENLPELIGENDIDECILAYSDLPAAEVIRIASIVNTAGADFKLMGTKNTMVKSLKPLIAICATRTGCGKSQTSRTIVNILRGLGKKVAVIRHPMPYGDLEAMRVQRFETYQDLEDHDCTFEEREEYEPHIENNTIVYAGVDYEAILRQAEKEADIVIWDGGNNDFSFYHADLYMTVLDPLRAGDEVGHYPGEISLRLADIVIINKVVSADLEDIERVRDNIRKINPKALVIEAASSVGSEKMESLLNKRVLVVEDGPSVTHGNMPFGAGFIYAKRMGVGELIDPRKFAVGSIKATFEKFPHLEQILPAMGYSDVQRKELEDTINFSDADVVIQGTPLDLGKILDIKKKVVKINYELVQVSGVPLETIIGDFVQNNC